MDFNFPVFATGIRIFRASNDVGPLFVGHGNTRIQGKKNRNQKSGKSTIIRNLAVPRHFVALTLCLFIVFVWIQDPEIEALHRY